MRAPGFSFWPGCTRASHSSAPGGSRRRRGARLAHEQTFHLAAARIAAAEESRRKDARVVEHQQIARAQEAPEVGERRVLERPARARHHQQPRTPAFGRLLRDERLGQLEVEIGNVHVAEPKNVERSNRPRAARSGFHRSPTFLIRGADVVEAEVLDRHALLDLRPGERRGHRGRGRRAHRIDARQRLPPRVLPVVNQHPVLRPRRLPVLHREQLGMARRQLVGQRLGEHEHVVLRRAVHDRDVHVAAARAAGLDERLHLQGLERLADDERRFQHLAESRARDSGRDRSAGSRAGRSPRSAHTTD